MSTYCNDVDIALVFLVRFFYRDEIGFGAEFENFELFELAWAGPVTGLIA